MSIGVPLLIVYIPIQLRTPILPYLYYRQEDLYKYSNISH